MYDPLADDWMTADDWAASILMWAGLNARDERDAEAAALCYNAHRRIVAPSYPFKSEAHAWSALEVRSMSKNTSKLDALLAQIQALKAAAEGQAKRESGPADIPVNMTVYFRPRTFASGKPGYFVHGVGQTADGRKVRIAGNGFNVKVKK